MSDASPKRSLRAAVCLLSCVTAACDGPSVATDAAFDRPDIKAYDGSADHADTATLDGTTDAVDASPAHDATMDALRDTTTDTPVPRDAPAADRAVADTFTWDIPRCRPGEVVSCACVDGRDGDQVCNTSSYFDPCDCDRFIDAGVSPSVLATRPLPARLLAPLSVSRVTSQRPTLRWVAPEGASRVRVELCEDRACTRVLTSAEVTAASWRPTTALRAGPVFWRVRALDGDGGATWVSATWEFFVGHRDAPVDTSFGTPKDMDGDGFDDLVAEYLGDEPLTRGPNQPIAVLWGAAGDAPLAWTRHTEPPVSVWSTDLTLSSSGDFDGNGVADLVTMTPVPDHPEFQGYWTGVLSGGARSLATALRVPPVPARSSLGEDIVRMFPQDGTCDFDGDGFTDIAVPTWGVASALDRRPRWMAIAHGDETGSMRRVDWMLAPALIAPVQAACGGDVNGDGYGDLILGLLQEDRIEGRAMMYLGGPGSMEDASRIVFTPPVGPWFFGGRSTRGAGDLNGDGFSDLVVDMSRDGVAVYYGRRDFSGDRPDLVIPSPPFATPFVDQAHFGSVYVTPGDFNGDGYADLVLSGPCANVVEYCGPGMVQVHYGSASGVRADPDLVLTGAGAEGMGWSLSAGDFNGDGYADLAIGDRATPSRIYVHLGGASGLSPTRTTVRASWLGYRLV